MRPDRGPGGFEARGAAARPALPWPRYGRGLDALGELHRGYRQLVAVTAARGSTRHAAGPAPGGAHQLLDDGEHRDLGRGLDARPYRYGKGNRGNGSGAGEREERTAWKAAKAANP